MEGLEVGLLHGGGSVAQNVGIDTTVCVSQSPDPK